jgi:hypothetical protein
MKNKDNSPYSNIRSFKQLAEEKTRLRYSVKYSEKKLELQMLELQHMLKPSRLLPDLANRWLSGLLRKILPF